MERFAIWVAVLSSLLLLGEKVLPVPFLTQLYTVLFLALVAFLILGIPGPKWYSTQIRVFMLIVIVSALLYQALPSLRGDPKLRMDIEGCDERIQSKQTQLKRICVLNNSFETVQEVEVAIKHIDPLPEGWPAVHEIRMHFMEDGEQYSPEGIIFADYTPLPKDIKRGKFKAVDIVQFQNDRPDELRIYHTASAKAYPPFVKTRDYCLTLEISGNNTKSFDRIVLVGVSGGQVFMHSLSRCPTKLNEPMLPSPQSTTGDLLSRPPSLA